MANFWLVPAIFSTCKTSNSCPANQKKADLRPVPRCPGKRREKLCLSLPGNTHGCWLFLLSSDQSPHGWCCFFYAVFFVICFFFTSQYQASNLFFYMECNLRVSSDGSVAKKTLGRDMRGHIEKGNTPVMNQRLYGVGEIGDV